MTKYTSEFKIKVVKEYLQGKISYSDLARKYHIPSTGGLKGWVSEYRMKGKGAFYKKTKAKQVYSKTFKENAVQLYLTSELTYQEVSQQLKITTVGLLCTWVNQYRKYGEIPEPRKHGRKRNIELMVTEKKTDSSEVEKEQRIKELERQLRYAKIEVEYLKGLRRLRNKVQTNKKQSSFTVSEKNTNLKKF